MKQKVKKTIKTKFDLSYCKANVSGSSWGLQGRAIELFAALERKFCKI